MPPGTRIGAAAGLRLTGGVGRHRPSPGRSWSGRAGPAGREAFERTRPLAPAVGRIERSVEFLELISACHALVAASGQVVPGMRGPATRRRRGGDHSRARRPGPRTLRELLGGHGEHRISRPVVPQR
ncbi:DUF6192 family protein [Streptomyces sp. NPDC058701]|uniref:DUF6192 family protein n=1 Tax=Streptomyces sp. NPDC058701 TaxID=3346608 RepID=UPI0036489251